MKYSLALKQGQRLCNKMEMLREFMYLGDKVCSIRGCVVDVITGRFFA